MNASLGVLAVFADVVILLALVAAVAGPRASPVARALIATLAFACAWLLTAVFDVLRAPGWTMFTGGAVIVVSIVVITATVHLWTQEGDGGESNPGQPGNDGGGGPRPRWPDAPQLGGGGNDPKLVARVPAPVRVLPCRVRGGRSNSPPCSQPSRRRTPPHSPADRTTARPFTTRGYPVGWRRAPAVWSPKSRRSRKRWVDGAITSRAEPAARRHGTRASRCRGLIPYRTVRKATSVGPESWIVSQRRRRTRLMGPCEAKDGSRSGNAEAKARIAADSPRPDRRGRKGGHGMSSRTPRCGMVTRVDAPGPGGTRHGSICNSPTNRDRGLPLERDRREPRVSRDPPATGAHLQASQSGCSLADHLTQPESQQHKVRAMTVKSESRITIASSVPEVWAYVCDVGRWPEWAPTVRECWVSGGAPLQPGSRVEQRAKVIFGSTRHRTQDVTAVEAPHRLAFAGPMGTSAARWGMELEPVDDSQTEAKMWVEVDLESLMRAIPSRVLKGRIQRVMDREMAAIKAAVESTTPGGSDPQMGGRRSASAQGARTVKERRGPYPREP